MWHHKHSIIFLSSGCDMKGKKSHVAKNMNNHVSKMRKSFHYFKIYKVPFLNYIRAWSTGTMTTTVAIRKRWVIWGDQSSKTSSTRDNLPTGIRKMPLLSNKLVRVYYCQYKLNSIARVFNNSQADIDWLLTKHSHHYSHKILAFSITTKVICM